MTKNKIGVFHKKISEKNGKNPVIIYGKEMVPCVRHCEELATKQSIVGLSGIWIVPQLATTVLGFSMLFKLSRLVYGHQVRIKSGLAKTEGMIIK